MKVLCIDQYSNWGGGQRSLLDLLPAFEARGWSPVVALPSEGPFAAELRRTNFSVALTHDEKRYSSIHKPAREILQYAAGLSRNAELIDKLVLKNEATLLYVNGPRPLPPAAWVARQRGIPLVFHCHHFLQQSSSVRLTGFALTMAGSFLIASCRYAASPIQKYVRPDRRFVCYNGVGGPDRLTCRTGRRLRRFAVIGRIEREKGQLDFVRAVRLMKKSASACGFSIIGSAMFSNEDYYRRVVAASAGLIDFAPWQAHISALFSNLDFLVVPSGPHEGTTRVILEAFAYGVPVIAFPSGGIPEILSDEVTGFLVRGSTPEALAERMCAVLQMRPGDLEQVTANARRAWQSRFTLDGYREQICGVVAEAGGLTAKSRKVSARCVVLADGESSPLPPP